MIIYFVPGIIKSFRMLLMSRIFFSGSFQLPRCRGVFYHLTSCVLCASLLLSSHVSFAQDIAHLAAQQFNNFGKVAFTEKVFLHTDKSFYLAGEVLWFKVYYVDGTFNKPADLSKVAYVEIFDDKHKPVMQGKVALKKGFGYGSFYLPSSLSAGHYTLRAYTNWMKNFGADRFFEQSLSIVNSLKPLPAVAKDSVRKHPIQFFPEGGNLVLGIPCKVAFQGTDEEGRGLSFSGVVTNQRNETVARFEPLKFGIGYFLFTPVAGDSYSASIQFADGQTTIASLPAAYAQGYSMRVEDGSGDLINVTVSGSFDGTAVFLLAHNKQAVKAAERKSLVNGQCVFSLDRRSLGPGISQLTVFTDNKQPVCERLYFVYPPASLAISSAIDAPLYGPRQPINLALTTAASRIVSDATFAQAGGTADGLATSTSSIAASKGMAANLSLSVYKLDSLTTAPQQHILSYLWLNAELKGMVESPDYYFSAADKTVASAMDNLMLVHGWRRFNWNDIFADKSPAFSFRPEFDGLLISGKIFRNGADSLSGDVAIGVRTFLSIPGTKLQFYPAISNADGDLHFDVRDYYGPGEIILQAEPDSVFRFDIANPFSELFSDGHVASTVSNFNTQALSPALEPLLTEGSINMQVQNAFFSDRISQFYIPSIDTIPFYGNGARQYLLDDYVRFTTTEEVLREYVPDVAVRKSDGHFQLYVFNWEIERHYKGSPLVLLDGVPVSIDKIMGYDPLKMRKLQVMTDRFVTGEFVYDGIISFTTYHGDLTELKLDAKAVIMDYDGLQLKREFYSPVYESAAQKASRLPDLRNQLLWNPSILTDASGKGNIRFYSSDLTGKYIGVIEGINDAGYAGSHSFFFEVK